MNIVVHYSEIGTKGENRGFFERKLIENIRKSLGKDTIKIYKRYGRIICELKKDVNLERIKLIMQRVGGISNFMFCEKSALDLEEIKKVSLDILKKREFKTFRIRSSRSNKQFSKTSQELNEITGEYILEKLKKKVKLKNPDVTVYIEICEKEAFIGCDKYGGFGGLPVGSSGKLVSSLSGGIDSPVASFLMTKRGCEIIFVHIHNSTQTNTLTLGKLEDILKQLTKFQLSSKLYVVPFEGIQRRIIMSVPSRYRMIIYRRFMMKILGEIASKEKARGIITGDSVGQVASQTIENLNCIYEASKLPVLAPLIGMNKQEIIELAKKIGTYEYSIQPYPDCCSFMIARHPETKGKIDEIKKIEDFIEGKTKLVKECVEEAEVRVF